MLSIPVRASTASGAAEIFGFLRNAHQSGHRVCLATITALEGSSSRSVGTLMGLAEDGSYAGSFSGGCVEAAVASEAVDVIQSGRARSVRFGAGSPYIDIRLPCGGGVDILFQPDVQPGLVEEALSILARRRPLLILQDLNEISCKEAEEPHVSGWQDGCFVAWHPPKLRLLLLGNGSEAVASAELGLAFGADVVVASPDEMILSATAALGAEAVPLSSPGAPLPKADRWTAALLFFHDHDWDAPLLHRLVHEDFFFIGAMGSRRTHAARVEALRAAGVGEERIRRVRSPLGLIASARDPSTMALSALAEVADAYRDLSR